MPAANAARTVPLHPIRLFFRALILLVAFACAAPGAARAAQYASIIVEAESGRVLHAVNADVPAYPASLTKMMTLYLVFEAIEDGRLKPNQRLPVSDWAAMQPPSKLGLKSGESIALGQAILALTTKSANDVAVVLAEAVARTEPAFADRMTAKAEALGMPRTVFRNASGLPDEAQISTARDLSVLSLAVIRDFPDYYRYFSAASFEFGGKLFESHNRFVKSYPGADGIKTGYIRASGFNLAASAERHGRRLVAVVLGGETARSRDLHMAELLDAGFAGLAAGGAEAGQLVAAAADAPLTAEPAVLRGSPREAGSAASDSRDAHEAAARFGSGSWAIQVGVFSSRTNATRVAREAAELLPMLPETARPATIELKRRTGKPLYRARVTGVSRDAAVEACRLLEKKERECIPTEA